MSQAERFETIEMNGEREQRSAIKQSLFHVILSHKIGKSAPNNCFPLSNVIRDKTEHKRAPNVDVIQGSHKDSHKT